jgi:endonuclease YncB( thermonuclease family)
MVRAKRAGFLAAAVALASAAACGGEGGGEGGGPNARVLELTDGDTYRVEFLATGKVEPVRLLGVDTPDFGSQRSMEKCNDPDSGDQGAEYCTRWRAAWNERYGTKTLDVAKVRACYDEGLQVLSQTLLGAEVSLTEDPTVGADPFGRMLRYVADGAGQDVSEMLVRTGRAIVLGPCGRCRDLELIQAARRMAHEGCLWTD